jgi:Asp-tRNA(Asn)/Glu-tRNA(Gln) amidotransferase A subunit family amidase
LGQSTWSFKTAVELSAALKAREVSAVELAQDAIGRIDSPEQEKRRNRIDETDHAYVDQLAWPGIATLPGLPATAIPLGLSPEGLPVGVQIVGPFLEDRTPLRLAEIIEREFGGFVPPPMFAD